MKTPFDLIKGGITSLINDGKQAFLNTQNTLGQNIYPDRGYPELNKPLQFRNKQGQTFTVPGFKAPAPVSFKDALASAPKSVTEIVTSIGRIGSVAAPYIIPGYNNAINTIANTKTGGLLADIFPKLEQYQKPTTLGQAQNMRNFDIATLFPIGSLKKVSKLGDISFNKLQELKKLPDYARVDAELHTLKELSLPGYRLHTNYGAGIDRNVQGVASTFPKWIPEDLRSKKLMDQVYTHIENNTLPRAGATKQKELYDVFVNHLDSNIKKVPQSDLASLDKVAQENAPFVKPRSFEGDFTKATSNESVRGVSKEGFRESKLGLGQQATPDLQDVANMSRLKELDNAYKGTIHQPIKNASDAKRYFNESEQIYKEMTDLTSFPSQRKEINRLSRAIKLDEKAPLYKDIGNLDKGFTDVFRLSKQVFKDTFPEIKKSILDPFDASKGKYIDLQNHYLGDLNKTIVKGLGINKGTKESSWLMKYGEGRATFDEVKQALGNQKAKNIQEADKWFRKAYNELLDEVNKIRMQIYPQSPEKWIPKRKDYYRHFQEMTGDLSGLKNIFENSAGIDPTLSGLSPFTKPRSKWASFAQKRLGTRTTEDAVGGFLNYLPSASYAIHIDPHIGTFRALANKLANSTTKSGNLNNFIDMLHKHANSLSGKTNDIDRIITDFIPGGRKTLRVLDWVNRRVKANTVLGNLSVSIAQIFNIPQGIASAKQYAIKGAVDTLADIIRPNVAMKQSTFLKERYFNGYAKFDKSILDNTKKFAAWFTGMPDQIATKYIWNSQYEKALAKKIPNPIKYADDLTRSLVQGRGIGEVPLIQQAKVFQMVAPFQLEVAGLWNVMRDFTKEKDFGAIAILFVANYLMNRGAEQVRGTPVTFDPIQATLEAFKQVYSQDTIGNKILFGGGRLGGEVLSNLPVGQTAAFLYPEYGFKAGDKQFPTRKQLFGKEDPTRFGSGLLAIKGVQDPLYKLLPPFAGSQIKKTIQGIQSVIEGGVFDKGGNLQFLTPQSMLSKAQSIVFGQYASKNARDYFNKAQVKLDEQTKIRPIFNQVKKLKEQNKMAEAQTIVDKLSEADYKIYKDLKSKEKAQQTLTLKKQILPTYLEVQKLKTEGKINEAKAKVEALTDAEYNAYDLIKKQVDKDAKAASGILPTYTDGEPQTTDSVIHTVLTYAKALGKDPVTTFDRVFHNERIEYVTGNTIIIKRNTGTFGEDTMRSTEYRNKMNADENDKLDHIIPRELGGSDDERNFKIVPTDVWSSYTPVENALGKALRAGKISKQKAQQLIKDFKDGKITSTDVLNMLK